MNISDKQNEKTKASIDEWLTYLRSVKPIKDITLNDILKHNTFVIPEEGLTIEYEDTPQDVYFEVVESKLIK